jgi:hypothetical protein
LAVRALIAALLSLSSAACATIGHQKVEGWPALEVVEHYVPHARMRERCARYAGFGTTPLACAEFHFAARQCHIWFSADFPPSRGVIDHERLHCAGYDHVGESTMKELLARHGHLLAARPGPTAAAGGSKPTP